MEKGMGEGNARLTIDERVENKLAVLLDQVVDVTKDSAASIVSQPQVSRMCTNNQPTLTTWSRRGSRTEQYGCGRVETGDSQLMYWCQRGERGVERAVEGRASGVNCRWRGERSMQLCAEYDVALFIQTSPAFQEHKLLT